MALSEFFPYGAPELLDGARSRMARSTMMGTLVVTFLVTVAGALMPRPVPPGITLCCDDVPPTWLNEPNRNDPEVRARDKVPPTKIAQDPNATPRIVEKDLVKEKVSDRPILPEGPVGDESGASERLGAKDGAGTSPVAADPEPGTFVVVDEYPNPVRCKDAVYPDLARAAGVEGTVRVMMLVGLSGHVERAIVAPKGSIPMLDQAALDAALTCVFTPALTNGHPVKVWVSQGYRFSLHSAP